MKSTSMLLIIDMQNSFFEKKTIVPQRKVVTKTINSLRNSFRVNNFPIIYTTIIHKNDGSTLGIETKEPWNIEGTLQSKIIEEITPNENEVVINKTRFSSYFNTNLLEIIKRKKVDTLYFNTTISSSVFF